MTNDEKIRLLNASHAAVIDPSLIGANYLLAEAQFDADPDCTEEHDLLADAMAIEALYLHHVGRHSPIPDYMADIEPDNTYTIHFVTISTGETVPVFIPYNGETIFTEW